MFKKLLAIFIPTRYYYVTYNYTNGHGRIYFWQRGRFPRPSCMESYLKEKNDLNFVIITNIVRVSKKEFKANL